MEVKINKEIRQYREAIFFGLSTRQFLCSALALLVAVGVYFLLRSMGAGETVMSWACILSAAPFAVAGFFNYNGLTFEQFLWAVICSEILCAGLRVFKSENMYYKALGRKEKADFD